jgi:hypothetical protein
MMTQPDPSDIATAATLVLELFYLTMRKRTGLQVYLPVRYYEALKRILHMPTIRQCRVELETAGLYLIIKPDEKLSDSYRIGVPDEDDEDDAVM